MLAGGDSDTLGTIACVGGASVFFGGVSLRLRERDFEADPEIVGDSGAEWPYRYADLEPFYSKAEQLLGVAGIGRAGPDGTLAVGRVPAGGSAAGGDVGSDRPRSAVAGAASLRAPARHQLHGKRLAAGMRGV